MWPFSRKLEDVLEAKKTIRVFGVKFVIKKIDPTSFLDGSKVMVQGYDTYKTTQPQPEVTSKHLDKVKEHFKDVFLASVVSPKLKRKEDGDGLLVDNIFTDWDFAHDLYGKIMEHTYGKKKIRSLISQKTNS